jgi:hypothetical protein
MNLGSKVIHNTSGEYGRVKRISACGGIVTVEMTHKPKKRFPMGLFHECFIALAESIKPVA